MTLASHARGPEFEPRCEYSILLCFFVPFWPQKNKISLDQMVKNVLGLFFLSILTKKMFLSILTINIIFWPFLNQKNMRKLVFQNAFWIWSKWTKKIDLFFFIKSVFWIRTFFHIPFKRPRAWYRPVLGWYLTSFKEKCGFVAYKFFQNWLRVFRVPWTALK